MRKVNKYTIIIISISLFIAMPLFLGTPKQRAAKREFSNKFEAYNAIKESLINELQKSNSQRLAENYPRQTAGLSPAPPSGCNRRSQFSPALHS